MKLYFLLLIVRSYLVLAANDYEITSISCIPTQKDVVEISVCECNKKEIWLDINLLKPLNDWTIQFEFFQKRGDRQYQIFKSPSIDWCKFNDGEVHLMSFQKVFIEGFQKRAPGLFHKCPFVGRHKFYNLSSFGGIVGMIPLGAFKLVIKGVDKDKNLLMTLTSTYKIF